MTKYFKTFQEDEDGAVTVDWVVLTAAVVGLATVAYIGIENQTNLLAADASLNITSQIGQ